MSTGSGSRPVRRDAHRPRQPDPRSAQPDRPPRSPRLQQPARGRRRLRVLVAVLVLVLLGALAWVLLASPVLGVRDVRVTGTGELTVEQVREAAAVPEGEPLLRLDTTAVQRRVEDLRRVREAEVSRSLTGTVEIAVVERTPVAVVPQPDGIHLVDATATDYATVPAPPPGLPVLRVPEVGPDVRAATAAVDVLTALPQPLRDQVAEVVADSAIDVSLVLRDGREVRWGATDQAGRKAAVLGPLLTQPGQVYDVTTPELATIS